MELHDKLTWELEANWKVVIDGFNENYHAAHLHTISPQDVKDGRFSTYFVFGKQRDDGRPLQGRAAGAAADRATTRAWRSATTRSSRPRCSTTIRTHLQLFRAVPIAVDRTRFEVWELWYKDGDDEYLEKTGAHWERLKGVVARRTSTSTRSGRRPAARPPTRATSSTTANARSPISTRSCRTCSTPTTETRSTWPPRITSQESTSTRPCARTRTTSWRAWSSTTATSPPTRSPSSGASRCRNYRDQELWEREMAGRAPQGAAAARAVLRARRSGHLQGASTSPARRC